MLRVAANKGEPKAIRENAEKRRVLFPGLSTYARLLGVHRNHLYLVLSGRRQSRSLVRRYRSLRKKGAK